MGEIERKRTKAKRPKQESHNKAVLLFNVISPLSEEIVCHRTAGRGFDFIFSFFFVKQFQVLLKASSESFTLCCCAPEIFSFANQMFCEIIGICIVVSFNKEKQFLYLGVYEC